MGDESDEFTAVCRNIKTTTRTCVSSYSLCAVIKDLLLCFRFLTMTSLTSREEQPVDFTLWKRHSIH